MLNNQIFYVIIRVNRIMIEIKTSCFMIREMSKTGRRSSPQTGKWESKELRASQGRKNHSAVDPAPEEGMEKAD